MGALFSCLKFPKVRRGCQPANPGSQKRRFKVCLGFDSGTCDLLSPFFWKIVDLETFFFYKGWMLLSARASLSYEHCGCDFIARMPYILFRLARFFAG